MGWPQSQQGRAVGGAVLDARDGGSRRSDRERRGGLGGGLPVTQGLLFGAGGLSLTAAGLGGGGLDGHGQQATG